MHLPWIKLSGLNKRCWSFWLCIKHNQKWKLWRRPLVKDKTQVSIPFLSSVPVFEEYVAKMNNFEIAPYDTCFQKTWSAFSLVIYMCISFHNWRSPRVEVINVLDSDVLVREFEFKSRYDIYFRTNTLAKGMNPFIPIAGDNGVHTTSFSTRMEFGIK